MCRRGFYCTVRSRQLVRVTPQGAATLRGWSPDSPATVSLKSNGEMKVISCRRYTFQVSFCTQGQTWQPGDLACKVRRKWQLQWKNHVCFNTSISFFFSHRFYNLNHKKIYCLHQTNLCSLQGLLGTSSCDAARVSRVLCRVHSGTFSW